MIVIRLFFCYLKKKKKANFNVTVQAFIVITGLIKRKDYVMTQTQTFYLGNRKIGGRKMTRSLYVTVFPRKLPFWERK